MIEHTIRINYLLDFYKVLLTEKQRFALEMYYQEDLSLVEIAQNIEVSRQAIYDLLKRGEALLEEYEKNLHLYKKYLKRLEKAEKLVSTINDLAIKEDNKKKIEDMINDLVD